MYDPELLVVVIRVFSGKLGRRGRGDVMSDVTGGREGCDTEHVVFVVDNFLHVDVSTGLELRRDLLEGAVLGLGHLAVDEHGEDDHQTEEDEERVLANQLLQPYTSDSDPTIVRPCPQQASLSIHLARFSWPTRTYLVGVWYVNMVVT